MRLRTVLPFPGGGTPLMVLDRRAVPGVPALGVFLPEPLLVPRHPVACHRVSKRTPADGNGVHAPVSVVSETMGACAEASKPSARRSSSS